MKGKIKWQGNERKGKAKGKKKNKGKRIDER